MKTMIKEILTLETLVDSRTAELGERKRKDHNLTIFNNLIMKTSGMMKKI